MRNVKTFVPQCLFAWALLAHGAAQAVPSYHVTVNTAAHTGQALMDFTFLANAGATPATAVLNNFVGAFGPEFDRSTGVTGLVPGQVALGNQGGGSYFTQWVSLGGLFSFDVQFDGDYASTDNIDASQFNATLYSSGFGSYIGAAGSFAAFELLPLSNGSPGQVLVSSPNGMGTVSAIPEPSGLFLSGLAMLGLVRRHKRRRVAASRHAPSIIQKTLVLATLAAGQAYAAPISLDKTASITATYNGNAEDIVGLDHDFQVETGSNTTTLDPSNTGVEFLTADALFGFDFSTTGLLTVYNNLPAASNADYRLTFDIGSGLARPIASFTLVDGSGLVSGVPGLAILGDHSIGLDLSGLAWTDGFGQFSVQLGTAEVPEPASAALVLAGAAGLAAARRKRTSNA